MASLATVGTGQDGAGWACSIALPLVAGVLMNHLTCIKCGDSKQLTILTTIILLAGAGTAKAITEGKWNFQC